MHQLASRHYYSGFYWGLIRPRLGQLELMEIVGVTQTSLEPQVRIGANCQDVSL